MAMTPNARVVTRAQFQCSRTTGCAVPGVSTVAAAWRPVKYASAAETAPAGYRKDAVVLAHAARGSMSATRSTMTAAIHHAIGKWTMSG